MRSFAWANSRAPRPVVITSLLIATLVAAIAVSVPRAERAGVPISLVAADDPYVVLDREITADFGMQNPVVWIVEADNGTVWTPALLTRIQALTREVLTIPGVIALDVVSLASPNVRDLHVTEDILEPVYLMSDVPQTTDAIDLLRRRVDNDPNYGGTLVSRDGRAAMVVANFIDDADTRAVAAGALALRERYSDDLARIAVTGAPVLAAMAPRVAGPLALGAVCVLAVGLLILALVSGPRMACAAAVASVLAVVLSGLFIAVLGAAVLPWSAYALLSTALVAVAVVTAPAASWQARVDVGVAVAMAFIALGVAAGAPAAAFGIAGAVGVAAAMLIGYASRMLLRCTPRMPLHPGAVKLGVLIMMALAIAGTVRLRTSFGLFGYGTRYLPESATADLHVLARHFPPPTALAVRFRGAPGFVASPEVLAAFDGVTNAVRGDPAVVRALSLADVVKMVHRAFNDNRDEFLVIPSDRDMIARYLALAYSPGFRTFVDRAFTQSALWVYLSSDRPEDLRRVLGTVEAQLARQPVPSSVQVDLVGGDGAVVLATAHAARRLAVGAAVLLLLGAAGIGVLRGVRTGAVALASGVATVLSAGGAFGWAGVPIDLVSFPILIAAAAAGMVFGALDATLCAPALAAMAVLALGGTLAGGNFLGVVAAVLFGAPALAGVLTAGWTRLRSMKAGVPQGRTF